MFSNQNEFSAASRENKHLAYAKNKGAVTAKPINAFVFATRIVQLLVFFLILKPTSVTAHADLSQA